MRRRTRELEEADRQKDQFLAAVAHELRSPLAVLTNVAQLLAAPQAGAAARQRALEALGRQTAHMARLVEDLLDLSRVRRGNVTLHRQAVDLWTVLSTAVEMGQSLVEIRKHQLEVAPFESPLWVSGDPIDLFTQVEPAGDGRAEGLGIGLTLVRRLVELHGGSVEATSEGRGRGSEFVVRLPALPAGPIRPRSVSHSKNTARVIAS